MDIKDAAEFHQMMINDMREFDKPSIGIFWYDVKVEDLFGVKKRPAEKSELESKGRFNLSTLHKTVWQREHFKALHHKDESSPYYNHDYTKVPRGRVTLINGKFKVFVGGWLSDPNYVSDVEYVKGIILNEFNLPEDTEFIEDIHWNIGHDWSEENL